MMQVPVTLSLKPVPWQRWALIGSVLGVLVLVLLIRAFMVGSLDVWIFLLILIPALGYPIYRASRQLMSISLTMEESGFRYTRPGYDISVSWAEVRTVQRRMWRGKLTSLGILTTQGKYVALGGVERLPEVADFIDAHAKSNPPDALGALQLNKNTGWVFLGILLSGVLIGMHYGEQSPMHDVGLLLQIVGLAGTFWLSPINFRSRQSPPIRRFFVLLAIWVAIAIVALLVLAAFSHKH
ncbi:MAG TPA: hypothetical protein VGM16_02330 [Gammaproteobacteria bacterium]|jgi:hypothetical protein